MRGRRVASVCTEAFLSGRRWVANGRRATAHWSGCDGLSQRGWLETRFDALLRRIENKSKSHVEWHGTAFLQRWAEVPLPNRVYGSLVQGCHARGFHNVHACCDPG